jgi:hypothetical protein
MRQRMWCPSELRSGLALVCVHALRVSKLQRESDAIAKGTRSVFKQAGPS